jgi:hypothetical protein
VSESENRLKFQLERLKSEKERYQTESLKNEAVMMSKKKERLAELENKVKHLEKEKNDSFIMIEMEKVKWNVEKEHLEEKNTEI